MPERSWSFTLLRAAPALAVAAVITFSADHSPVLGFTALGGFAVVTGAVLVAAALGGAYPRTPFALQGGLLVAGGIAAFAVSGSGVPVLLALTSALIGATGVVELVTGLRGRGRLAAARDWIFVGGLSVLFALVVLLVPADFVDVVTIPGKDGPPLTASIMVVGLFGAYAAIVAVYLAIAGFSLKWAPPASTPVGSEG